MSVKYKGEEYRAVIKDDVLTLDLSGKGIKDIGEIEGFETLTDLKVLNLSKNQIAEISNLDYLIQLRELDLSDNQIKEIQGLSHLIRLKKLNLERNKFINIKGFENLINLENLSLGAKYVLLDRDGKVRESPFLIDAFGLEPSVRQCIRLNGKELVGFEEKIVTRSPINIVAYCRVGLKRSRYTQRLVPADLKMVKLEKKIEKEMKKYQKMIKKAVKRERAEKFRQRQNLDKLGQTRLY